ncbi:hypothetical protein [Cellulomonas fimi]|uniref:Uncharacterized protein n=1 Tax=Cellulomonas fimi TaxID=1708 RepID=A0A7Y0LX59_CELFI|nr:hypothetical protein [Cellulomonas fimi]NMR19003.1 hypothetical protein [Cellulomonas fimi]
MNIDVPNDLLELLFLRSAWGLDARRDLPPCDPAPDPGASQRPAWLGIESVWERMWDQATSDEGASHTSEGANFWGLQHGTAGIDLDALRHWKAVARRPVTDAQRNFGLSPERRNAEALRTAERRGLRRIILLPVIGSYREVRQRSLILSTTMYLDRASLTGALDEYQAS